MDVGQGMWLWAMGLSCAALCQTSRAGNQQESGVGKDGNLDGKKQIWDVSVLTDKMILRILFQKEDGGEHL